MATKDKMAIVMNVKSDDEREFAADVAEPTGKVLDDDPEDDPTDDASDDAIDAGNGGPDFGRRRFDTTVV